MKEQAGLCEFVCKHVYQFVSICLPICQSRIFFVCRCAHACVCVCLISAIQRTAPAAHEVNTERKHTQKFLGNTPLPHMDKIRSMLPFYGNPEFVLKDVTHNNSTNTPETPSERETPR